MTLDESIEKNDEILISAIKGDSWIAFKVDQKPVVRFILKKGNQLKLDGSKIRLTIGNATAVDVKKNGFHVELSGFLKGSTAYLIYPEKLREIYKPPFFVFDEKEGTAFTQKQFQELNKDI